jgi:hypothetical protein
MEIITLHLMLSGLLHKETEMGIVGLCSTHLRDTKWLKNFGMNTARHEVERKTVLLVGC